MQFHAISAHKFLLDELAAFVETELHDGSDEIGCRDDVGADIRLLDVVDHHLLGQSRRVVHLLHLALFRIDHIRHVGHGRNHVHVELAVEPFLHDFHVQQTEKTAAEAEAERHARFRLERERSVVQLELLQRCAKVFVVRGVDGIHAGKHHRLHLLKALNGLLAGSADVSNRVAHLHLLRILDAADDIAYLARAQFLTRNHLHFQHAHLVGVVLHTRVEEFHLVALANHAVFYLEIGDDATERVEDGVENQCLQRRIGVARGRRDALHHCLQNRLDALTRLSAGAKNLLALASQQFHDFVLHLVGHGRGHVDFVDDGDDFEVVLDGHVEVRDGLRLHALRGVHHEQRTLAGSNRAAHLVREIDVSRRVNQVQDISIPSPIWGRQGGGFPLHLDCMALDGDAALLLQIHVVEHLPLGDLDGFRVLQQSVGQGRFAVVDMRYDAEISDVIHVYLLV